MATVDARLAALREFLKSHAGGETVFIVEGGGEYFTKEDPFNYLMAAHCPLSAPNRGRGRAELESLPAY